MAKTNRIFCAGFGGQGVLMMGQLISHAGMLDNKEVTWCPAYGPEMRGGTANCSVVVSDRPIAAPVITANADIAVVMNRPSLERFESILAPGGTLFVNSSLIDIKAKRRDINVIYLPVNDIAKDMGMPKMANMIMLGAMLEQQHIVPEEKMEEAVKSIFGAKKPEMLGLNKQALQRGAEMMKCAEVKKAS